MKHPVRDRFWILLCTLAVLCAAAAIVAYIAGYVTLEPVTMVMDRLGGEMTTKKQVILGAAAAVLVLIALRLFNIMIPAKKKSKRTSNFAIQQNENGMVRISLKALESLVQRCLNQHNELKVVTSSLYSDEQTVSVDVHITLQSDISMPLAISALQKQIKRYLEACSGVVVKEVRVFVDGAMPAKADTAQSPYAIPASVLEECGESLAPVQDEEPVLDIPEAPAVQEAPAAVEDDEESVTEETPAAEETPAQETAEVCEAAETAEAEEEKKTEESELV